MLECFMVPEDRLTIYVKYPGWFTLASYYWRLWCSWVRDELASGEPRESKGLLQSSPSLVDISKESAELWLGKTHCEHIHVPLFSSCSCSTGHIFWQPIWYHCRQLEFSHLIPFCFHDTDLLQIPQGYFLCLIAWPFVINSWNWKAIHDFFRGMPVVHHVKIPFGLFFIVRTIASPPIGLRKIFIDFQSICFLWTTFQNVPNMTLVSFPLKGLDGLLISEIRRDAG